MGSIKALSLAGAVLTASAGLAVAADFLPPAPRLEAPIAAAAEFSGWYLRGDVGTGATQASNLRSTFNTVPGGFAHESQDFHNAGILGLGAGYKFNNWFRADVTGEYRSMNYKAMESYTAGCPVGFVKCLDLYRGKLTSGVFLANGYVDLGTWSNITPYVGAGIGSAYTRYGSVTDINPSLGGYGTSPSVATWKFAWALMAGIDVNLSQNLKLDVGYRYLNMGQQDSGQIVCAVVAGCQYERHHFKMASHDVRIGLRYQFGDLYTPAPAPMMAPGPLVRKY